MTRLGTYSARALEAGWLAIIVTTPLYFNVYTSRVFEPDKATLLRDLSVMLGVVWLTWWLEVRASGDDGGAPWGGRLRAAARANPLLLPAVLVVAANILATFFSVAPAISFWGSYLRLQGLLTALGYFFVFVLIATQLRHEEQAQRFGTIAILTSVPVGLYAIIQRLKLDPLLWGADVSQRVTSSQGNPIFLSAFLLMVTPLVVARLAQALAALPTAPPRPLAAEGWRLAGLIGLLLAQNASLFLVAKLTVPGTSDWWAYMPMLGLFLLLALLIRAPQPSRLLVGAQVVGYGLVLGIHLVAAVFSQSRGPWLGLLAGVSLVVLLLAIRGAPRVARVALFALLVVGALALVGMNLPGTPLGALKQVPQVGRLANLSEIETGTGRVRLLVWQGGLDLVTEFPPAGAAPDGFRGLRPLVGYGPETLYFSFTKVFPVELWLWEGYGNTPDRAHNEIIDQLAMQGALGLLSWLLAMHVALLLAVRLLGLLPAGRLWPGLILTTGMIGVGLLTVGWLLRRDRGGAKVPAQRYVLVAGLLAALVGHFVEVQLGIAIVATRTYAWAIFGVLAALWLMQGRLVPAPTAEVAGASGPNASPNPGHGQANDRVGAPGDRVGASRIRRGTHGTQERFTGGFGTWWLVPAYAGVVGIELMALRTGQGSQVAGPLLLAGQVLLMVAVGIGGSMLGPRPSGRVRGGPLWPSIVAGILALWIVGGNTTLVAADAIYKEAQAHTDARRPLDALPHLQRAAQMAPREDFYLLRLGGAFLEMAQSAPVGRTEPPPFRDLTDVLALDVARVRSFKRDDHFLASELALQHALRLSPLNTDHYANLGRLYLAWGLTAEPARLPMSVEHFERATRQSPRAPQLLQELARAQFAAKQYDGAAETLAQARRVMARYVPDATLAGDIALARGQVREGLASYAPAFADLPPPAALTDNAVDWRLDTIVRAGLANEAIAALERARDTERKANPASDHAINVSLGFLYYRTGRLAQAAAAFEAAVRAQPQQWLVHRNLGLVYNELGQRDRAVAALQQAQRYAPRNEVPGLQQLITELQR